jgi:hypothetical protein
MEGVAHTTGGGYDHGFHFLFLSPESTIRGKSICAELQSAELPEDPDA